MQNENCAKTFLTEQQRVTLREAEANLDQVVQGFQSDTKLGQLTLTVRWLPVCGYEEIYEVSEDGQVRKKNGRLLKQFKSDQGYALVRVSNPRKVLRVHRVVAEAFLPNPTNLPFVNHINCIRDSNSVTNLEWCTQWQNLNHSRQLGRMQSDYWLGRRSPNASLTEDIVAKIRSDYAEGGVSWEALAKRYSTNKRTVGRIILGDSYV